MKRVLIIGGGFSGVSLFAHLVEKGLGPLHISLIDKSELLGTGVAFSTNSADHLLNVRACRMGMFAERPGDFYDWLSQKESEWRAADPRFLDIELSPDAFYARKIYGLYLRDRLKEAKALAQNKGLEVRIVRSEVTDLAPIGNKLRAALSDGTAVIADFAVLATGIPPAKRLPFETSELVSSKNYYQDVWKHPLSTLPNDVGRGDMKAVILGAGLTAIDVISSLYAKGFRGIIHLISRSGRMPEAHFSKDAASLGLQVDKQYKSCLELFRFFRKEWRHWQELGQDLRELIDSFRPHTLNLWSALDERGKRTFLRHLFSTWNRYRHRMAGESAKIVCQLKEKGQLVMIAGKIINTTRAGQDVFQVEYMERGSEGAKHLLADIVFNCTGPEYDLARREDLLIQKLLLKKMIQPDPLNMGLKTEPGQLLLKTSIGSKNFYALGAHLFGERFETTAVPEIREQAARIAEEILSQLTFCPAGE